MPDYGLGLDIGTFNTKIVCIKKVKKETSLVDLVLLKGSDPGEIKNEISRIFEENKIKDLDVATSVSGPSVVVRFVEFPEMAEDEVKNAIALESERYLPFRYEDVNLDLHMFKGSSQEKGKMQVLVVAARKDLIKKKIDFLESAGINPSIIDIDALSLSNCFEKEGVASENAIALINIGSAFTNFCVIEQGFPRFTRDIPLGGSTITSHLQKRLSLNPVDAENYKIKIGLNSQAEGIDQDTILKINDATKEIFESFFKEIRYSLDFHQTQSKGKVTEKIYLSGGTSFLREIGKYFSVELGLPVEIWNPLSKIVASQELQDKWQNMASIFPVSLGLAYKGLEYA